MIEATDSLLDRLIGLQVGGCTCMTKTPEVGWHKQDCTYRVANEAFFEIVRLSELTARIAPEPGEQLDPNYKLPCDVKVAPATIIGKGCSLSTLMTALRVREGQDVQRFIEMSAVNNSSNCPKCGQLYISVPRLGIHHVCPPETKGEKP